MPLPEWLAEPVQINPPSAVEYRQSWILKAEKRLARLSTVQYSNKSFLVIDPRAALTGFIILIVCTTLLTQPFMLILALIAAVFSAYVKGVGFRIIAGASAAIGLLTAALMLPAATSLVNPGERLITVSEISITSSGLLLLCVVVLRSTACVIYGFALFASNRPEQLFSALRSFRIPGVFIAILIMSYRYIGVIAKAAGEAHTARRSRIHESCNLSEARHWLGERIGALFARSRELGEAVYNSMVSRGFDGEWIPRPRSRLSRTDIVWIITCLVYSLLMVLADRGGWS
ncbi:MAG TPA: cobalt ECF transporter T component CbiQ [Armatimonadota bacterium]|nr:cobalt ECF transporter T component CbiQ [Armatimonadota bacterium]